MKKIFTFLIGNRNIVVFLLAFFMPILAIAQSTELPFATLPLDNLSSFKSAGGNWQIAGDVFANRNKEHSIRLTSGTGILINTPTGTNKENLFTDFEHGDIELDIEFMMAKGSTSGIYFQGRYGVQLSDSWGVQNPRFSDCGGVNQRWNPNLPEGQRGYQGQPPRINASRAPGLWQNLKIIFKAPEFNEQGEKVANAKFVKVVLNGVMIHQNVEVTGPTQAAALQDQRSVAPLMIQAGQGPIAIRNFQYKLYGEERIQLEQIHYKYYEADFPDFKNLALVKEGRLDAITQKINHRAHHLELEFNGIFHIPKTGIYLFELVSDDGGSLQIGDRMVVEYKGLIDRKIERADGKIYLEKGRHTFRLIYSKIKKRRGLAMGLYSEGPGIPRQALHDGSLMEYIPEDPIFVMTENKPALVRSFIEHKGKKKTHAISVGGPGKVHYSMDLNQGALLHIWKGDFLETTKMWNSRGFAQLAFPLGSVIELSGAPPLAYLSNKNTAWPDSLVRKEEYLYKRYNIDTAGYPIYEYRLKNIKVEDHIVPKEGGKGLIRELRFESEKEEKDLWCRIAEGSNITLLPDGSYGINDKMYYIEINETSGLRPIIREMDNRKELLVPIRMKGNEALLNYSIIW